MPNPKRPNVNMAALDRRIGKLNPNELVKLSGYVDGLLDNRRWATGRGLPRCARVEPLEELLASQRIQLHFDEVAALLGGALPHRTTAPRRSSCSSPALSPTQQRVALAHGLVHDERGGGCDTPGAPEHLGTVVAHDKRPRWTREVARRLVPAGDLAALSRSRRRPTSPPGRWPTPSTSTPLCAALALNLLALAADERSACQGVPSRWMSPPGRAAPREPTSDGPRTAAPAAPRPWCVPRAWSSAGAPPSGPRRGQPE